MGLKNIGRKAGIYISLGMGALSMILSNPLTAKAAEKEVLEDNINPKTNINLTVPYKLRGDLEIDWGDLYKKVIDENSASSPQRETRLENLVGISKKFSEEHLFNVPEIYARLYLADLFMVAAHEWGHNDEAFKQGLKPSLKLTPMGFWVNGNSNYDGEPASKKDEARISAGGFTSTGNLAEFLRGQIMLYGDKMSPEELGFMSMLAFVSEANLPFYLGQYYGQKYVTGEMRSGDDINNYCRNSDISPETMAVSSGLHFLLNAPYIYMLARNAVGHDPKVPEAKPYDISVRYNGGSYSIWLHVNTDMFEVAVEDWLDGKLNNISLPAMRK